MSKNIIVIGSGFSGLSSACYLAKSGYSVTVIEKNNELGGRARTWIKDGFTFDMGPSWYWMADIFEEFFKDFDKQVSDYYELIRLDPAYRVFHSDLNHTDLPAKIEDIKGLFQKLEKDGQGAQKLEKFLEFAEYTYQKGVGEYMRKPSNTIKEFIDLDFLSGVLKAKILNSYGKEIDKQFENPVLREILKFPTLFLGSTPEQTPYLYSLMAYTQLIGGTHYPKGGMHKIVEAMVSLATELGVKFITNSVVTKIITKKDQKNDLVTSVEYTKKDLTNQTDQTDQIIIQECDYLISSADYEHTEQTLLDPEYRRYDDKYWDNRELSPSSLLFYVGIKEKINGLEHHNLFFDTDFNLHAKEIYTDPRWPSDPLFYVCCPSKTDSSIAPIDCENIFILIPLAPNLKDTQELRNKYFKIVVERMQKKLGIDLTNQIIFKRDYCIQDFKDDYNSYKGNAYGLANTLRQTAIFKPKIRSKLSNMFYAGQLTVPGPGVPPSIISGKIASQEIINLDKKTT